MPELFALLPILVVCAAFLYYLSCNPGPGEGLLFEMLLKAMRAIAILLVVFVIAVVIRVFT